MSAEESTMHVNYWRHVAGGLLTSDAQQQTTRRGHTQRTRLPDENIIRVREHLLINGVPESEPPDRTAGAAV